MNEVKQREQLHRLLDIVLDGNGFEHRARERTGTLPTLFFDFSGHVNYLSIRLYEDGWETGAHYRDYNFYLDYDITDEKIEAIRAAVNNAFAKHSSDVLRRDIEQKEKDMAEAKKKIANMKRELRKMKKKEGIA